MLSNYCVLSAFTVTLRNRVAKPGSLPGDLFSLAYPELQNPVGQDCLVQGVFRVLYRNRSKSVDTFLLTFHNVSNTNSDSTE